MWAILRSCCGNEPKPPCTRVRSATQCLSACHGMATKANSNVTKIRSIYILPLGLVRPAPKNIDLSEFVEPVSTMGPNGGRTATSVQFQKQPVEIACYFDFTEPTRSGSA